MKEVPSKQSLHKSLSETRLELSIEQVTVNSFEITGLTQMKQSILIASYRLVYDISAASPHSSRFHLDM